ncbi:MAG: hypothetical protein PHC64_02385 [Candidatus Gastranaerophilales bacterium]|nr:hypothetical protein [Candidatus Gastranaerophilales bacterium]
MFIRKIYLKIRLFLYSIRKPLNRILTIFMIAVLSYFFINYVLLQSFILPKANYDKATKNYESAIVLYNFAYSYYSFDHFSNSNRKIFFSLPYKIAMCYIPQHQQDESVKSMLKGLTSVQKQYGYYSRENAYFIRKYLIKYFLTINNLHLAQQEFNILFNIYKTIGHNKSDLSEMLLLSGNLASQQKKYNQAIDYYERAYNNIIAQDDMDYEVFAEIIDRICDYQVKNNQTDQAIDLYDQSIDFLKSSSTDHTDLLAEMLISLGDLYAQDDKKTKEAIACYEEGIDYIKKLPKSSTLRQNITMYLLALKDLYNKDGQYDKAAKIDVELARKRRFSFLF